MIINLTQHAASEDQRLAGVYDVKAHNDSHLKYLLTFNDINETNLVNERAEDLAKLAVVSSATSAMVGGAPYLMGPLCAALKARNIKPLFAYSDRVSVEDPITGVKTSVFKHLGFVEG
jgi:hypothetical protein